MKEFFPQLRVYCKTLTGRSISRTAILIALILVVQTFNIPSKSSLSPIYAPKSTSTFEGESSLGRVPTSESVRVSNVSLLSDSKNSNASGTIEVETSEIPDLSRENNPAIPIEEMHGDPEDDYELKAEIDFHEDLDDEFTFDIGDGVVLKKVKNFVGGLATSTKSLQSIGDQDTISKPSKRSKDTTSRKEEPGKTSSSKKKKKKKEEEEFVMPPVSVSEMNQILLKNHASHNSIRPRWLSPRDKELLAAKAQIENAPPAKDDQQLYAPAFRNIAKFKRSYELMEKTLKVYVYKEGEKPIFHQPLLKGIYASEGWFMKLMETNKQYIVRDPKKAHLFYIPFSSRLLQFALYVRNSHKRRNLEEYLKNYIDSIAARYPFWNRTGGSDHFLVACHDWAPYETRSAMQSAIRALCVADLNEKFQLGKDVSLPETYVRSAKDPLRDLGGLPAANRSTLAFYSGNNHGKLRPVLLHHWENEDPDNMKIYGPLPRGLARKLAYIEHMKSSRYCICPKGFEVNSPRVVESIFYECVPVIISDNYVPPFFEVLNWEAFSVIVAESEVPRLKEILTSIGEERYFELQEGVRRVQQHFVWHSKPVKYDLFHMILHSIWFNRVYNVGVR